MMSTQLSAEIAWVPDWMGQVANILEQRRRSTLHFELEVFRPIIVFRLFSRQQT